MTTPADFVTSIRQSAASEGFALDASQVELVERLAVLGSGVLKRGVRRGRPRSLYVHGSAGRGKSWLADAFYAALPTSRKSRVHFHSFFDGLHRRVQEHRGEGDAVERAIDDLTRGSRLLFFDELHVHDSGDARLLTRLLEHVFARDLPLLATSNYAPDELLPNPIWHHTFEPGIALIKTHMDTFALDGPTDYRAGNEDHFSGFAAGSWRTKSPSRSPDVGGAVSLDVRGRSFHALAARSGELWITFDQICRQPTSTIEYLEWTRTFARWVITGIPAFGSIDAEAQQRFINLVDILVDSDTTVTFVADNPLAAFLTDATRRPDGFRMASRLHLLNHV